MDLTKLKAVIATRTQGRWFSSRQVTMDLRQLEADEAWQDAMSAIDSALVAVVEAGIEFYERCEHTCPNPSACWICDIGRAKAALAKALLEAGL